MIDSRDFFKQYFPDIAHDDQAFKNLSQIMDADAVDFAEDFAQFSQPMTLYGDQIMLNIHHRRPFQWSFVTLGDYADMMGLQAALYRGEFDAFKDKEAYQNDLVYWHHKVVKAYRYEHKGKLENPILHLNLKKKWFDMVSSGEKKVEYREVKPYWDKVFQGNKVTIGGVAYDPGEVAICFSNGYSKDRKQIVVKLEYLRVGPGLSNWGAEQGKLYYCLGLGKVTRK